MPEDSDLPTTDQLSSVSERITLPYEELKELKAAAAAASETGLSVTLEKLMAKIFWILHHCCCKM